MSINKITFLNIFDSVFLTFLLALFLTDTACNNKPANIKKAIKIYQPKIYCNPVDIDYTYSVVSTSRGLSYRSGADPAVVRHKDELYMFVTRSQGYRHSKDLRALNTKQDYYFAIEAFNENGISLRIPPE